MLSKLTRRGAVRLLIRGGTLLFAFGALLDLAAHLRPALGAVLLGAVTFETGAHLVTLAGMVVLLLAVMGKALQPPAPVPVPDPVRERRPPA